MRKRLGASVVVLWIATASTALADVGPAPSCPSGTHSAYLMGRRCVRDGYHLEQDANHNVVEVADAVIAPAATQPAPATAASAEPVKPKTEKAGACAMTARRNGGVEMLTLAAALALTLLSRRRATSRASG